MTDIVTTAPIAFRRPAFTALNLPKLGLGRAFARTLGTFGQALDLAYVQPYRPGYSKSPVVLEGSEKGRDSAW